MPAPKVPKPRTSIFDTRSDTLGKIAGPIRVEVAGDVIWAVGGTASVAYRFAGGVWTSHALRTNPNFILAISETEAIVGGFDKWIGRTIDAGVTWSWEQAEGAGWMICGSRDHSGRIWIGQQSGIVFRAEHSRAPFERMGRVAPSSWVCAIRDLGDGRGMVVSQQAVHEIALETGTLRRAKLFEPKGHSLIDGVVDDRGRIAVVADRGAAWFADNGRRFHRVETGLSTTVAFDAVFWLAPWFIALAYDGALRVSTDGHTWKKVAVELNRITQRLGGIAAYRDGWLVGVARNDDGNSGALVYLGDPAAAPLLPAPVPDDTDDITFVIAERYALLWASTWAALPGAEQHAAAWMKLAKTLS